MKGFKQDGTFIDGLESRTLLSGSGFGGDHFRIPNPPSAAVTADLAKIKTDTAALRAAAQTAAPALRADRQALEAAVKTAETTTGTAANTALTTLRGDRSALQKTIQTDFAAILAARTSNGDVAGAVTKLRTDLTAGYTTLGNDEKALRATLTADPGVAAAQAKITADSAPVVTAQGTLAADYVQLAKDVKAQFTGGTATT